MKKNDTLDWLSGVFCALITPINSSSTNQLDEISFERVIEHVLQGGVNGLVVLGSAGEYPCFDRTEKQKIIKKAINVNRGRVPIIVGAGNPDYHVVIEDITMAKEEGAAAALVAPPFYYPMSGKEIENYYKRIALETEFPIILYNVPGYTKISIDCDTVERLSPVENIIGIKDTSRDFLNLQQLLLKVDRENNAFRIFLGTDIMLMAGIQTGVDGVISISCNFDPRLDVDLWLSCKEGDFLAALHIQERILKLFALFRQGSFPASLKSAVSMLGISGTVPCFPISPLEKQQEETLRRRLGELGYEIGEQK